MNSPCRKCRKIRYCMEQRGVCTSFEGGEKRGAVKGNSGKEEKASERTGKTAGCIR